jgi:rubredoxin
VLTALVLFGFVLVRVAVVSGIIWLLIPSSHRCPACGQDTVPIQRTGLVRLIPGVERRMCTTCGWSWFRRRRLLGRAAPTADREVGREVGGAKSG